MNTLLQYQFVKFLNVNGDVDQLLNDIMVLSNCTSSFQNTLNSVFDDCHTSVLINLSSFSSCVLMVGRAMSCDFNL